MTPTIALSRFFPEVNPTVVGCPEALMTNAVRNACIEFCNDTLYWQDTQGPLTLTATDFPYSIDSPSGTNVAQVMSLSIGGRTITPKSSDWLDANYPGWATAVSDSTLFFYQPDPNTLVLVPQPATSVSINMRVALMPSREALTVPATLHQYYLEGIAAGALSRLCAVPGQAWTDEKRADYFARLFSAAITNGTIDANKSYDRTGLRVQLRPRC